MPDIPVIIRLTGPAGSGKSILQSLIEAMLQSNNIKFESFNEEHKLIVDMKLFIRNK